LNSTLIPKYVVKNNIIPSYPDIPKSDAPKKIPYILDVV
jgi:hypothetical protein